MEILNLAFSAVYETREEESGGIVSGCPMKGELL